MSIKCKLGMHQWDGCQCTVCGKVRDEHHDLSLDCEKCARCGHVVIGNHDWSHDCEKCSKCGKTRENAHSWEHDCEKCSKCGKHRENKHHMVNGLCEVCGHGKFNDPTDGKTYEVVKIGNRIMMAENYAHKAENGNFWAYEGKEENKASFGYLYDWETAIKLVPKGWHLPTKEEWDAVFQYLGGDSKLVYNQMKVGGKSGFDAQLAGWRSSHGAFNGLNASAHFWCSTEAGEKEGWQLKLNAYSHHVDFEKCEKGLALSVRLFKD